jgi:hypothetical protein
VGPWRPSFYDYDGGGNVRQLTNTAGTVTDSYEYDAYGNSFTRGTLKAIKLLGTSGDWGSCALDLFDFVKDINDLFLEKASATKVITSLNGLAGCVGDTLGALIDHPGSTLQSVGLE